MASITITIPNSDWGLSTSSARMLWQPNPGSYSTIGTSLTADGSEAFLGRVFIPTTLDSSSDEFDNFYLAFAPNNVVTTGGTGPDLSDQMETSGTITLTLVADPTASVTVTGISDSVEPYSWTPSNLSDLRQFGEAVQLASNRSITITFNDNAGVLLTLANLNTQDREFDMMGLFESAENGSPLPSTLYADADRGGTSVLIDGEFGVGSSQVIISRIRLQVSAGTNTLVFNDNDDPTTIDLGPYFDSGGDGDDLSLTVQTASGGALDLPPSAFRQGGLNFVQWTTTAAMQTLIESISFGDRVIVALWRTATAAASPSFTDSTGNAQSWTQNSAINNITVPAAAGSPAPTYAAVGTLPNGIAFNTVTRIISGTPTVVSSGTITIQASNSEGSALWTVDYATTAAPTTLAAPVFGDDTGDVQAWAQNAAITPIIVPTATGNPSPTYANIGNLPTGISFNTGSRVISGTPTAVGSGTITIRASNSQGNDDWTVAYAVTAPPIGVQPPSFADPTGDTQNWTVGIAIAPVIIPSATGDSPITYAVIGILPDGIVYQSSRLTQTFNMGVPSFFGTSTIQWTPDEANASIDEAFTVIAGSTINTFSINNAGQISFLLANPNGVDDLIVAAETAIGLFTLQVAGQSDLSIDGPNAPGATTADAVEPYNWTPGNSSAIQAWRNTIAADTALTMILNVESS